MDCGPRCAVTDGRERGKRTLSIPEAIMTRSNAQPTHGNAGFKRRELFQCLSDGEMPKRALGASIGLHGVLLMVLILVPVVMPQTLHINYRTMILVPVPKPAPEVPDVKPKPEPIRAPRLRQPDRKSTRLNSSHVKISYAVFCLK